MYSVVLDGPLRSGSDRIAFLHFRGANTVLHAMNDSKVSETEQPEESKGEEAFANFCARFEPLVRRTPSGGVPDPPREDFIPLLQAGILRKLWAHRPPDAEPFVRRTAHMASLIHRHNEGLLAVEALAAELDPELRSCFKNEFSHVPFSWEDIRPKFVDKLVLASPSAERAAEFNGLARTILVNLVIDELRRGKKEILESDLRIDGKRLKPSRI